MRTPATKPILFSETMVRAILDGRKTMTRRLPDKQRRQAWEGYEQNIAQRRGMNPPKLPLYVYDEKEFYEVHPPYRPGDLLWVRETWMEMPYGYVFRADDEEPEGWDCDDRWRPSIHMPKDAARLFLRVKNVRMERLQDISLTDVEAEGIDITGWNKGKFPVAAFSRLWDSMLKPADLDQYGWFANPWVWVIAFERVPKPELWPET